MSLSIAIAGCSHGRHRKLMVPDTDVLVYTGDYSRRGDRHDAIDFLKWFQDQSSKYKIFVDGNHDGFSEESPEEFADLIAEHAPSCDHLCESGVVINGIHFWGSPVTPFFLDWWWNRQRGSEIRAHWDKIPDNTQVLITHGPAYGHLDLVLEEHANGEDRHQGCRDLRDTIDTRLRGLKAHLFSHLHLQGCETEVSNGVTYVNAAVVNDDYLLRGRIPVIEINA